MRRIGTLLTITIILYVGFDALALEVRSFSKEWSHEGNETLMHSRSLSKNDTYFFFAVCSDSKLPTHLHCNVSIERFASGNVSNTTCDVRLKIGKNREISQDAPIVWDTLGDDKVIVSWWEQRNDITFLKLSIVRMNNCTLVNKHFPLVFTEEKQLLISNVVLYPRSFEVLLSNKQLCGSLKCRILFDEHGRQIGSPVAFHSVLIAVNVKPVLPGSPAGGHFVAGFGLERNRYRVFHVNATGGRLQLMSLNLTEALHFQRTSSAAHQLYGVCWLERLKSAQVHCRQYGLDAKLRLNATLNFTRAAHWMAVHNIADGGLLLLTGCCEGEACNGFNLTVVEAGANATSKSIEVTGVNLNCSSVPREMAVDVRENAQEFCFYFACVSVTTLYDERFASSLKFVRKCSLKKYIFDELRAEK